MSQTNPLKEKKVERNLLSPKARDELLDDLHSRQNDIELDVNNVAESSIQLQKAMILVDDLLARVVILEDESEQQSDVLKILQGKKEPRTSHDYG